MLGVIGLAHALFLWFGDILFYYACVGLVLMAFVRCETRTQALWGIGFYALAVAMMGVLTAISLVAPEASAHAGAALDPARLPDVRELVDGLTHGAVSSPDAPVWIGAETRALRDGPFWDATSMRLLLWVSGLFFYFLLTGHVIMILGLFLLGSAMMRSGVLVDLASPWPKRMVIAGLGAALPLSIMLSYLSQHSESPLAKDGAAMLHALVGPIQSMGYLGAIVLLYRRVKRPGVLAWLESAGRMPLTNYLTQSVVGAAVFLHWGFEQFGAWPYWQCVLLVLGVFAGQLIFSRVWMATFRFGPMEWLWRTLSYGRMPVMRRGRVEPTTGE